MFELCASVCVCVTCCKFSGIRCALKKITFGGEGWVLSVRDKSLFAYTPDFFLDRIYHVERTWSSASAFEFCVCSLDAGRGGCENAVGGHAESLHTQLTEDDVKEIIHEVTAEKIRAIEIQQKHTYKHMHKTEIKNIHNK